MLKRHLKQHRSTINITNSKQLTRRLIIAAIALVLVGSVQADTFTVTNINDAGDGSLRLAVRKANGNAGTDDIVFDQALNNSTITLTSGEIVISDELIISGPVAVNSNSITIDGNNASRIFNVSRTTLSLTVSNITLSNGVASNGDGGAICGTGVFLILNNSVVSENISTGTFGSGEGSGGGLYTNGRIILNRSTVSGNKASRGGGGVYGRGITLNQSTISGNSAIGSGGGVVDALGFTNLYQSTITGNSSLNGAGGIFSVVDIGFLSHGGTLFSKNSIISGNYGPEGNVQNGGTVDLNVENSLFGDPASKITGNNIANVFNNSPDLGALLDHGGSTPTHLPNVTSPALDAGNNANAPSDLDQRGLPRIFNGIVDIGSVERQPIPVRQIPVLSFSGLLALIAGLTALVGWRQRLKPDKQH